MKSFCVHCRQPIRYVEDHEYWLHIEIADHEAECGPHDISPPTPHRYNPEKFCCLREQCKQAEAKLAAVEALHPRGFIQFPGEGESHGRCMTCVPSMPWPCPTVAALGDPPVAPLAPPAEVELMACCKHCGCPVGARTGHDDSCDDGCNDAPEPCRVQPKLVHTSGPCDCAAVPPAGTSTTSTGSSTDRPAEVTSRTIHVRILCRHCQADVTNVTCWVETNTDRILCVDCHELIGHDERCCMTVKGAREPHPDCPGLLPPLAPAAPAPTPAEAGR